MNQRVSIFLVSISAMIAMNSYLVADWGTVSKTPHQQLATNIIPTLSVGEHYTRATDYFNEQKWDKAAKEFRLVAVHFPQTSYGQDANYYLGISYFNMGELDFANEAFDHYLQCQSNPQYFRESIEYKFSIAERFRLGDRRRCFGINRMPKWAYGYDLAVGIYDEVIAALPGSEMAAQALYGKGIILEAQKEYRESVEAFQTLINRFPKSELAPDCFLEINRVYLSQCQSEFQNPDLVALAEINLRKFELQFPGEERLELAREELLRIKEVYAQGMYETAYFYERVNQPAAAVIYYQKAITDFPDTHVAFKCRDRLRCFCPQALEDLNNIEESIESMPPSMPENVDFTRRSQPSKGEVS